MKTSRLSHSITGLTLLIFCMLLLGSCSSVTRNPVPKEMHLEATVLGDPHMRGWGDEKLPDVQALINRSGDDDLERKYSGVMHREHNYLAISGGGAEGAYTAGLLTGWTDTGTRPEFTIVTGISTGALIAPFAFLGSEYDEQLKEIYTTTDSSSIFKRKGVFSAISGDSLVDTSPLVELLEEYITDEMVARIGNEFLHGRSLQIGTTNLDAGRPVIWEIGRIAASGHPDASNLIRQIMRASTSISGAFPPVYIEVTGPDGRTYDEMHVDGGTSSQMFFYPRQTNWREVLNVLDVKGTPTAYLIRNALVKPEYKPVDPKLIPISGKTIQSLIRTQGIGDFYRIYAIAQRDGIKIRVSYIQTDAIDVASDEAFDRNYMNALFDYGYQKMQSGEAWKDASKLFKE